MANHEKLYEAFGELLYVVAMADGVIQEEEVAVLEKIVQEHPWGKDIKWSFDYERSKERNIDEVYARVLDYCKFGGENPEYENMIDLMTKVAEASDGIDAAEQEKINTITKELSSKLRQDLYKIYE